ncbi:MAG: hypothetical protein K5945_03565 [Bacteroidaceae bacterium]|nr:hypothetical protein [Bacteroidaceae bacterium]
MGTKASLVVPNQRRKAHYPVLAGDRDGSLTRKQRFERPDVSSAECLDVGSVECLDVGSVESLKTQRDVPSSLLKYKMSEQEPDTCLRAMPIQWSGKSHPILPEVGRVGTEEKEVSEGTIRQKFKCKMQNAK